LIKKQLENGGNISQICPMFDLFLIIIIFFFPIHLDSSC